MDAQVRGSISGYALVSTFRAFVELHTGRLDEALTDAGNGLRACQEYSFETGIPYAVAHIADAALELGDVEVARTAMEQLDAVADGSHLVWAYLDSRGRTRIATGDTRAGLEDVLEAGRQYEASTGAIRRCSPGGPPPRSRTSSSATAKRRFAWRARRSSSHGSGGARERSGRRSASPAWWSPTPSAV